MFLHVAKSHAMAGSKSAGRLQRKLIFVDWLNGILREAVES